MYPGDGGDGQFGIRRPLSPCRTHFATRSAPEESSERPQCDLRLLTSVKSPLHPSAPPRVKRTHTANQMKRVQGDESPWRSLGRAAPAYPPRKTWQSQYDHAKAHLCPTADSVLCPSRPFVPRRDRRQKTCNLEVNQQSRITAPTIREHTTGDLDPRRNRNSTSRKPFCLAPCGKQQA